MASKGELLRPEVGRGIRFWLGISGHWMACEWWPVAPESGTPDGNRGKKIRQEVLSTDALGSYLHISLERVACQLGTVPRRDRHDVYSVDALLPSTPVNNCFAARH